MGMNAESSAGLKQGRIWVWLHNVWTSLRPHLVSWDPGGSLAFPRPEKPRTKFSPGDPPAHLETQETGTAPPFPQVRLPRLVRSGRKPSSLGLANERRRRPDQELIRRPAPRPSSSNAPPSPGSPPATGSSAPPSPSTSTPCTSGGGDGDPRSSPSLSALKFPHLRQRRQPGGYPPLSPSVLLYPKTLCSIAWCLSICWSLRIFYSEQERMFLILFMHNAIYGSA